MKKFSYSEGSLMLLALSGQKTLATQQLLSETNYYIVYNTAFVDVIKASWFLPPYEEEL